MRSRKAEHPLRSELHVDRMEWWRSVLSHNDILGSIRRSCTARERCHRGWAVTETIRPRPTQAVTWVVPTGFMPPSLTCGNGLTSVWACVGMCGHVRISRARQRRATPGGRFGRYSRCDDPRRPLDPCAVRRCREPHIRSAGPFPRLASLRTETGRATGTGGSVRGGDVGRRAGVRNGSAGRPAAPGAPSRQRLVPRARRIGANGGIGGTGARAVRRAWGGSPHGWHDPSPGPGRVGRSSAVRLRARSAVRGGRTPLGRRGAPGSAT